jgi:cyclopropane-fatty-acyl-phospholipid synthase
MQAVLHAILKRFITRGRLAVRWPDGRSTLYAGQPEPGLDATIAFADARAVRRLVFNPTLGVGEAYMDGHLTTLDCNVYDMLAVMISNADANLKKHPGLQASQVLRDFRRRFDQFNPATRAQRNVAHHYDLNGRLYSLFLDRDRQYSCAYFPRGDETLEEAQAAKKRHIAAKLCLDRPNLRVLDIGSGWGGLALHLARHHGAQVTGITLSAEQLAESRARAAAEGLSERVQFELLDYRAVERRFDRIVSVGMFEHVGVSHYPSFFKAVDRSLSPDGVALLHYIGRTDGPGSTNAWIRKYIFPGGYCPALSEVTRVIERSGLVVTDLEVLRMHYAETLRHWRWRFAANRDAIASLYDERFCRMFEFYLAASELTFRAWGQVVHQVQIARAKSPVPLTRDYIAEVEHRSARSSELAEGGRSSGMRLS